MGVVKLADYRPQLEVVEHRVADTGAVFCGNLTLIQVQGEGA